MNRARRARRLCPHSTQPARLPLPE